MFSRSMARHATRLISTGSGSSLTTTSQRSWAASKSWAFAASKPRMKYTSRYKPKFISTSEWLCRECGNHNIATREVCACGHLRRPVEAIECKNLPAPIGPYSYAVKTPTTIYVSGQLPTDNKGNLVEGTMSEKTAATIKNIKEILASAHCSLDKVVKVQVFLTDMEDYDEMNEEYEGWFDHRPARSCVAVKELPRGASIEIDCIATP